MQRKRRQSKVVICPSKMFLHWCCRFLFFSLSGAQAAVSAEAVAAATIAAAAAVGAAAAFPAANASPTAADASPTAADTFSAADAFSAAAAVGGKVSSPVSSVGMSSARSSQEGKIGITAEVSNSGTSDRENVKGSPCTVAVFRGIENL
eukprot:GHVT01063970.1.p1 GENE.GHVT01063970.1~~GHVT01063970.1.p1  ORF type:complete len:149 (-),score=32.32 GHVT01063970.1:266-712(-)